MSKPINLAFEPLTAEQMQEKGALPKIVHDQSVDAEKILERINDYNLMHPKRGPRKIHPKSLPVVGFCAETEAELDNLLRLYRVVVGKPAKGNSRRGKKASLYADLVSHFSLLRQQGVTLPRGKSLSAKACQYGLGEILRRHGYDIPSDQVLLRDGRARRDVANMMDGIFSHVTAAFKKTPL